MSECANKISLLRKLFREFVNKEPWDAVIIFQSTLITVGSTTDKYIEECEQISAKSKHIQPKYTFVKVLMKIGTI